MAGAGIGAVFKNTGKAVPCCTAFHFHHHLACAQGSNDNALGLYRTA